MADDEGRMVFASYYPGPTPDEAKEIILTRARALWHKAQAISDPVERGAAEAEAWKVAERARTPGRFSVAVRSELLRQRRALEG